MVKAIFSFLIGKYIFVFGTVVENVNLEVEDK